MKGPSKNCVYRKFVKGCGHVIVEGILGRGRGWVGARLVPLTTVHLSKGAFLCIQSQYYISSVCISYFCVFWRILVLLCKSCNFAFLFDWNFRCNPSFHKTLFLHLKLLESKTGVVELVSSKYLVFLLAPPDLYTLHRYCRISRSILELSKK